MIVTLECLPGHAAKSCAPWRIFSNRRGAENLVREAYMRRKIQQAIASGIKPEQIVVVTGAFHASVLGAEHPAMTDEELAKLRSRESKMTLMPYSFFKL